jgi:serine protease Do
MKNMTKYSKTLFLSTVIAFASTSFIFGSSETTARTNNKTEEIRQLPKKEVVNDFRAVAKKAIPAVVAIKVSGKRKNQFFGEDENPFGDNDFFNFFMQPRRNSGRQQTVSGQASGAIVRQDGYILTNSHVVHGMDSITIQMTDGREFPAKVIGDDPNTDLALIKIEAKDIPFLSLGNSDDVEVGQPVAAIGNPFGLQGTLTTGVVSAKSRNNLDLVHNEDFIQTDAAINQGNSGGPLITLDGEIIGINSAIATNSSSSYMGIGFAIPSNIAKHVMDEILSDGKVNRGYMGVTLQPIDYNLAQSFGMQRVEGALINSVLKNSPAEKAGLQVEDIIVKYNGRTVDNAATLRNAINMMKPGTKVNLTILRKEKLMDIPLELSSLNEGQVASVTNSQKNQLGIEVMDHDQGVVISKINPNTVASLAGLKKGSVILAVNRQKVDNVDQYYKAVQQTPEGLPVLLQIMQGDTNIFVSLKAE